MQEWIDIAIPTTAHHDFMAAKCGDRSARYRVMMRARSDPDEHERVRSDIQGALSERWKGLSQLQLVEEMSLLATLYNDDLVRIDVGYP